LNSPHKEHQMSPLRQKILKKRNNNYTSNNKKNSNPQKNFILELEKWYYETCSQIMDSAVTISKNSILYPNEIANLLIRIIATNFIREITLFKQNKKIRNYFFREIINANNHFDLLNQFFINRHFPQNLVCFPANADSGRFKILTRILCKYQLDSRENFSSDLTDINPRVLEILYENLISVKFPKKKNSFRKQTGSFYTPQKVAELMINESIREYLAQILIQKNYSPERSKLKQLVYHKSGNNPCSVSITLLLLNGIFSLRILDPACGGGVFPLGILNRLSCILKKLDPDCSQLKQLFLTKITKHTDKNKHRINSNILKKIFLNKFFPDDFIRKLYLLKFCLWSVDIQPAAVEITKTRIFLALINHLRGAPPSEVQKILHLFDLNDNLLSANTLLDFNKSGKPFDIIIGNPPYIESRNQDLFPQKLKVKLQKNILRRWQEGSYFIKKGSDLLIYFFEWSISNLKPTGVITFITQNSWLTTEYGRHFQNFLKRNTQCIRIIDSGFKHFPDKSNTNINTIITHITLNQPSKRNSGIFFEAMRNNGSEIQISRCGHFSMDNELTNHKWGLLRDANKDVIRLLEILNKKTLGGDIKIGQGMNLNKSYLIDSQNIEKFKLRKNYLCPFFTIHDGAVFSITGTRKYIVNPDKIPIEKKKVLCSSGISILKTVNRKIPSLILPRGLGRFFCAVNQIKSFSSSYVEIYLTDNDNTYNIWCFLKRLKLWI
jgi:hypothetical protein